MHRMHGKKAAWAACFGALLVSATALARAPDDPPPDPETALAELEAQFESATEEYFAPYREAKSEAEAEAVVLDPEKDPRKTFFPRFVAFANAHEGTAVGAQALVKAIGLTHEKRELASLAAKFVESYAETEAATQFAQQLPMLGWMVGNDEAVGYATTLVERAKDAETVAAALFSRAQLRMQSDAKAARADLETLKQAHGDTAAGASADGFLFELEHLQIGMVAPDFETTDEDGVAWKLSDYRGKVVVVDFWGFW